METVKVASLGQITDALFNVGGQYWIEHMKVRYYEDNMSTSQIAREPF